MNFEPDTEKRGIRTPDAELMDMLMAQEKMRLAHNKFTDAKNDLLQHIADFTGEPIYDDMETVRLIMERDGEKVLVCVTHEAIDVYEIY